MAKYSFTFNKRTVEISNIDTSCNKEVDSNSLGFEQTIFDNIEDTNEFTDEELNYIASMPSSIFLLHLKEI